MANMNKVDPKSLPSLKSLFARLQPEPSAFLTAFGTISQQNGLAPPWWESFRELNLVPYPNVPDSRETAQHATELLSKTPSGTQNTDAGAQNPQLGALIARGAKTRAILRAISQLEEQGQLPDDPTAKARDNKIEARIIANGGSVANSEAAMARAIQRAYRLRRR